MKLQQIPFADDLYEQDFYAWTVQQADLIRTGKGKPSRVDWQHIAEEIESMGRREKRELISRLEVLLLHLLKWQYQPARRGSSWARTIREQRIKIADHLEDNPSLRSVLPAVLDHTYELAIIAAVDETGLPEAHFPMICPYTSDEMLDKNFWPETKD